MCVSQAPAGVFKRGGGPERVRVKADVMMRPSPAPHLSSRPSAARAGTHTIHQHHGTSAWVPGRAAARPARDDRKRDGEMTRSNSSPRPELVDRVEVRLEAQAWRVRNLDHTFLRQRDVLADLAFALDVEILDQPDLRRVRG